MAREACEDFGTPVFDGGPDDTRPNTWWGPEAWGPVSFTRYLLPELEPGAPPLPRAHRLIFNLSHDELFRMTVLGSLAPRRRANQ